MEAPNLLTQNIDTRPPCFGGGYVNGVGLSTSIITFVALVAIASYLKAGSLYSIVAWSGAGGSSLFIIAFAISCHRNRRTHNQENSEQISPNLSTDRKHSHFYKSRSIYRKGNPNSTPPNLRDIEKKFHSKQYGAPQNLSKRSRDEDPLCDRVYFHLLSELLDPIYEFLDFRLSGGSNTAQKILELKYRLSLPSNQVFQFLVEKKQCKNDLQDALYHFCLSFFQIDDPRSSIQTLRNNLLKQLHICSNCNYYKENKEVFFKLSEEEGKERFPEMSLLHFLVFELTSQISISHFFHEALNFKGEGSKFTDDFSFVLWQANYQSQKRTITPQFVYDGTFKGPQGETLSPLFLDYCAKNQFKCLFFPQPAPDSLDERYKKTLFFLDFGSDIQLSDKTETAKSFMEKLSSDLSASCKAQLNRQMLSQDVKEILTSVHRCFFKSQRNFNKKEKQVFLQIAQALLVERIVLRKNIDFFFFQGRTEREICLMATLYALSLIRQGNAFTNFEKEHLKFLSNFSNFFEEKGPIPLLQETTTCVFTKQAQENFRKAGIEIGKELFSDFMTFLDENPNHTILKLPSEAFTAKQNEEWLKEDREKPVIFFLSNYVHHYFDVEDKKTLVDELVVQFNNKDFERQQCLIESKKIDLPNFKEELRKLCDLPDIKSEFPKRMPRDLVSEIIKLEAKTADPLDFYKQLQDLIKDAPLFLAKVKECYFAERRKAVRRLALAWTGMKASTKKEKEEFEEFIQKGTVYKTTAAAAEIIAFLQQGTIYDATNVMMAHFGWEEENTRIQVNQSPAGDFANTCFNLFKREKHRIIEATQRHVIIKITPKEDKETIFYFATKTEIDLDTKHGKIISSKLEENPPTDNLTAVVIRSHKSK